MKEIISKELLSKVLGITVRHIKIFDGNKNAIFYSEEVVLWNWKTINIYELAHRCKEWAWNNGFILVSKKSFYGEWSCRIHEKLESEAFTPKLVDIMLRDTEAKAIFEAIQFIFDNKN